MRSSEENGAYGIPALGEIGRQAPELLAPHLPALIEAAADEGLRLPLLQALAAVAETAPALITLHLAALEGRVDLGRPAERQALAQIAAMLRQHQDHDC